MFNTLKSLTLLAVVSAVSVNAITCLNLGAVATATFTNAQNQTCTYTGTVGSNFGPRPDNGVTYDCNGRCGVGCTGVSIGNAYTQNCWSHDICSFFFEASGGAEDPNCGRAFLKAVPDYLLGTADGCGKTNPTNPIMVPAARPVCA